MQFACKYAINKNEEGYGRAYSEILWYDNKYVYNHFNNDDTFYSLASINHLSIGDINDVPNVIDVDLEISEGDIVIFNRWTAATGVIKIPHTLVHMGTNPLKDSQFTFVDSYGQVHIEFGWYVVIYQLQQKMRDKQRLLNERISR